MSVLLTPNQEGLYPAASPEQLSRVDIIIGHEFGAPAEGCGHVNELLAQFIVGLAIDKPLYVHENIAEALAEIAPEVEIGGILQGTSANTRATHGGTRSELEQVLSLSHPARNRTLHIAHARHVTRVMRQARLVGLLPVAPPDLPNDFDANSTQWWCRGRVRWELREMIGKPVLKLRGHL